MTTTCSASGVNAGCPPAQPRAGVARDEPRPTIRVQIHPDGSHTGPIIVRFHDQPSWVSVLCPLGHSYTALLPQDMQWHWGGSWLEAKIAWHQSGLDPWIVTCHGALPKDLPAHPAAAFESTQPQPPR